MDFDLEIINEEDDCPNHLFESIMNAMNSMKEATADKIYQKIQRDGETNYSKPQVDKALANALKYGIFEVRNNRYRVRDDILDEEDTVYWKLNEKKEQTPFQIQERISEKHFGLKLDPERDNQRFRKIKSTEVRKCPYCGRTKKLKPNERKKIQIQNKSRKIQKTIKSNKNEKKLPEKTKKISHSNAGSNRKERRHQSHEQFSAKRNKENREKKCIKNDALLEDFWIQTEDLRAKDSFDSRYSYINLLEEDHNVESSKKEDKNLFNKPKTKSRSQNSSDSDVLNEKRSSMTIKSDSESGRNSINFSKDIRSHSDTWDSVLEFKEEKISSRNENRKGRNQYLQSTEVYHNHYDNNQTNQPKGNSDWLGHSDEPQGAIIQSNNVLTIEPMDSLAFKSPEQASYIT